MILDSVANLLPGLLPGAFRGIDFFAPDTTTEVGRRVAETLFPGIDRAAYDDFGVYPADVSVEGLLVGDDYIAQAKRLRAAFERAGPGTLIHPWLGGMTVILTEPAEISFSASELRVARFSARFKRIGRGGAAGIIATAADLLLSVASARVASVNLASRATTLSAQSALASAQSWRTLAGAWSGSVSLGNVRAAAAWAGMSSRIASLLAAPLAALPPSSPDDYAASMSAVTAALTAAIVELRTVPAVSPAAESPAASVDVDPRAVMDLCLGVSEALIAAEAPSTVDRALLLAAAGDAVAGACEASVYATYISREDASAVRNALASRIDALTGACVDLQDGTSAAAASTAARTGTDLKARMVADINEVIGRLPSVIVLPTETDVDAFQVANHVYGDDPGSIEAGYRTIVARNRPRHPARLPAGRVEALR